MRLAIFSDLHLGFGRGSERENDAFEVFEEIINIIDKEDIDAVLIPGDIFDSKVPPQEVIANALELFSRLSKIKSKSNAKVVKVHNIVEKRDREVSLLSKMPIITISGTHERRAKNMVNPVKILEKAGFVVCLHAEFALLENEVGEKVAVHGLSGVPEIFARKAIQSVNFKAIDGVCNIFMLHQSIKNFVYMDDEPTLTLEDLPKGFDLIIDGHIHWANEVKIKDTLFLIPGSTITTQIRKTESKIPKFIYFYDTETKSLEKKELKRPRKTYYLELDCSGKGKEEIKEMLIAKLNEVVSEQKEKASERSREEESKDNKDNKPLVRVILKGVVDEVAAKCNYAQFLKPFEDKLIISYSKDLKSREEERKKEELGEIMKNAVSIDEMIERILIKNAEKLGIKVDAFDIKAFLDVLESGDVEKAEDYLEKIEENSFEIHPKTQALKESVSVDEKKQGNELKKLEGDNKAEKLKDKDVEGLGDGEEKAKKRKPSTLFDFGG